MDYLDPLSIMEHARLHIPEASEIQDELCEALDAAKATLLKLEDKKEAMEDEIEEAKEAVYDAKATLLKLEAEFEAKKEAMEDEIESARNDLDNAKAALNEAGFY